MKKLAALVLALVVCMSMGSTALADPPKTYSSVPTEGVPANGSTGSAEGQMMSMLPAEETGIHFITWRNQIAETTTAYLKCYSLSITDFLADKIQNEFVLQQWNGTEWITYSTSTNNWMVDTDIFSCNIYRAVARGYYYRVKTTHKAWLALYYDSKVLYSSYIYVD